MLCAVVPGINFRYRHPDTLVMQLISPTQVSSPTDIPWGLEIHKLDFRARCPGGSAERYVKCTGPNIAALPQNLESGIPWQCLFRVLIIYGGTWC